MVEALRKKGEAGQEETHAPRSRGGRDKPSHKALPQLCEKWVRKEKAFPSVGEIPLPLHPRAKRAQLQGSPLGSPRGRHGPDPQRLLGSRPLRPRPPAPAQAPVQPYVLSWLKLAKSSWPAPASPL